MERKQSNEPFFSVILPVRNGEKSLYRAIGSILSQTFSSYELLTIVNDSQDRSLEIAESFSSFDQRVRALEIPDSGVSKARNHGIAEARGEYIVFLDADDFYSSSALQLLFETVRKRKTPVVMSAGSLWNRNANERCLWETSEKLYMTSLAAELYQSNLNSELKWHPSIHAVIDPPWGKAYRKTFLCEKGITFDHQCIIYGDILFNSQVLRAAECFVPILMEGIYSYQVHEGSLSKRGGVSFFRDGFCTINRIIALSDKTDGKELEAISYEVAYLLFCLIRTDCQFSEEKEKREIDHVIISYLSGDQVREHLIRVRDIQRRKESFLVDEVVPLMLEGNIERIRHLIFKK